MKKILLVLIISLFSLSKAYSFDDELKLIPSFPPTKYIDSKKIRVVPELEHLSCEDISKIISELQIHIKKSEAKIRHHESLLQTIQQRIETGDYVDQDELEYLVEELNKTLENLTLYRALIVSDKNFLKNLLEMQADCN